MHKLIPVLLVALIATATPSMAAPTNAVGPFSTKKFVYKAEGKKLSEVLQDFAAAQGVPIVIDSGVDGTVNATFNSRPWDFLNALMKTYGIIWYHDGTTLFIYPASAMQSRVFRMRGFDREQVRQMLGALGLGDARFPLRFDDHQQTLLAYGPQRHIELISAVVDQLERANRDRVGSAITIVPLLYASADDRHFGNANLPGLVSTLNQLFGQGKQGAADPVAAYAKQAEAKVGSPEKIKALDQAFGARLDPTGGSREAQQKATEVSVARAATEEEADRPFFQAESSSNAIIIRGLPDRMKEYEALVHQLDVPQRLVEIQASIIDVNTDAFESLGIDWNFLRNGTSRLSFSSGAVNGNLTPSTSLPGANITTVLGNAGRELLAHIIALQGHGKAHIISQPRVLGAVNRMAMMSDTHTASVRVAGNLDASLYSIQAGTTLQVMPQVITYPDHREVRLSLSIQDGQFNASSVDSVPIVDRTQIDTEATIREGESLLIGGITTDSTNNTRSGLPGLSGVPFLGALFRHDEGETRHTERLFMLTPRIVEVGVALPALPAPEAAPLPSPQAAPNAGAKGADANGVAAAAAPAPVPADASGADASAAARAVVPSVSGAVFVPIVQESTGGLAGSVSTSLRTDASAVRCHFNVSDCRTERRLPVGGQ